jgi:hypothetical protein
LTPGISSKAFSALSCRLTQRQPEEPSINLARLARTGASSSTIETEIFMSKRKISGIETRHPVPPGQSPARRSLAVKYQNAGHDATRTH